MSWRRTERDEDEMHDDQVQEGVDDAWFAQQELLRQQDQETTTQERQQ